MGQNGFTVINSPDYQRKIVWEKVTSIEAFKRDLLTTDVVCLVFHQQGLPSTEIHEEMIHFDELVALLPLQFRSIDQKWLEKVIKPAFASNFSVIWQKE